VPSWGKDRAKDQGDAAEDAFKDEIDRLDGLLLTLLFVVPATGLLLIAGERDWLAVHIGAQLVLLAVIAAHVALVLSHTVVLRDGQLSRMV
jgi:cytochrome b561